VEISLRFHFVFSQCYTSIYPAFDGQTEFSQVFNLFIYLFHDFLRKFDALKKYMLNVKGPV